MTDHPTAAQHHAKFEGIRHVDVYTVRPELVEGLRQAQPERVWSRPERVWLQPKRFLEQKENRRAVLVHAREKQIEDVLTMVDIGPGSRRHSHPVRPELVEGHLGMLTQRIRCRKFMVRQAHHERGQTGRGQTGRGQTGRGQTGRGQAERGQAGRGQTGRGQTERGQTGRGQARHERGEIVFELETL